jgi:hypothetical protein
MQRMSPETRKNNASFICMMLTACVLSAQVSAAETAMKSIDDYLVAENTGPKREKNPAHGQFVGLRCHALFSILVQYGNDNGMKKSADTFQVAKDDALRLAVDSSVPLNTSFLANQIKIMIPAYNDIMQKNKALTGSSLSAPPISSDIKTCTEIFGSKK